MEVKTIEVCNVNNINIRDIFKGETSLVFCSQARKIHSPQRGKQVKSIFIVKKTTGLPSWIDL